MDKFEIKNNKKQNISPHQKFKKTVKKEESFISKKDIEIECKNKNSEFRSHNLDLPFKLFACSDPI